MLCKYLLLFFGGSGGYPKGYHIFDAMLETDDDDVGFEMGQFALLILISTISISMSFTVLNSSLRRKALIKSSCLSFSSSESNIIPRAAVAVVVRWSKDNISSPQWLLVQRGKEPNKGMWSIPGGSIEVGESTLEGAKRELQEETGLTTKQSAYDLRWHEFGPFACSDSIHENYHYVISQCFAEVISSTIPNIQAEDDADDARWWSEEEVKEAEDTGLVSKGVHRILQRSEILYTKGLLD